MSKSKFILAGIRDTIYPKEKLNETTYAKTKPKYIYKALLSV